MGTTVQGAQTADTVCQSDAQAHRRTQTYSKRRTGSKTMRYRAEQGSGAAGVRRSLRDRRTGRRVSGTRCRRYAPANQRVKTDAPPGHRLPAAPFGARRRGERRRCLWAPSLVADQEERRESHTGVYFYNQAVMFRGHGGVKSCKTSRGFGEALELSWWLS